jgi:triacylglycerol lipase
MPEARPSAAGQAGPSFLSAALEEGRALLRVATLLPRDLRVTLPRAARDGDDVVLLVHGSLATAGAWRPLRAALEALGSHTATFTHGPGRGVAAIADAIREVVERLPERVRIHLVGHSLGGLAVRWFVQETRGDPRVVQTISLAPPFEGARGAMFLPGPAGRDMRAGSHVLRRLGDSASRPSVPHLSIYGGADTAVSPATVFPTGGRVLIRGAGHNALLFDERARGWIVGRVRGGAAP